MNSVQWNVMDFEGCHMKEFPFFPPESASYNNYSFMDSQLKGQLRNHDLCFLWTKPGLRTSVQSIALSYIISTYTSDYKLLHSYWFASGKLTFMFYVKKLKMSRNSNRTVEKGEKARSQNFAMTLWVFRPVLKKKDSKSAQKSHQRQL